ncbi:hypothetical protein [Paenibacillus methanolicus]|uniref:Uncharacterized protein n=1 Tax=Paenibacillus methanolicus TaxID=582686 RepID=A0A5S5CG96_9BACL|nr:hypothetical protein [Paenibacillus methanolicus]TYP77532.1 hypothetical protein BCM02_10292 [Paenibacillus methanolicus]
MERTVCIVPYRAEWALEIEREQALLARLFGRSVLAIQGETASAVF